MKGSFTALLLCLCSWTLPCSAQWVHSVKDKNLKEVTSAGRTSTLEIPPAEVPSLQRFRVSPASGPWTIDIVTPDDTRLALDADSFTRYVAYDDVVEIPISTPGAMSFTGSPGAPTLAHVSAVIGQPSPINKYPFGDFNLEPVISWPASYRKTIEPAVVVLWGTGKAAPRPCNATQISPNVFVTAHHCVRDIVDDDCRRQPSGSLRVFVEQHPIDDYGNPTAAAMASAVEAIPVFCGHSNNNGAVVSDLDYAIVMTAVAVRGGAILPPVAVPTLANGTYLLLPAYLSRSASGQQGSKMANYPPDFYLSQDNECRIPSPPINDGCPPGHIVHKCDSWPTMSGAPVLRRTDTALIGVHHFWTGYANCALPWSMIVADMRSKAITPTQKSIIARFP